jgi:hypothetical protein
MIAKQKYGRSLAEFSAAAQSEVSAQSQQLLQQNKYAVESQSRGFTDAEVFSYQRKIQKWTA